MNKIVNCLTFSRDSTCMRYMKAFFIRFGGSGSTIKVEEEKGKGGEEEIEFGS